MVGNVCFYFLENVGILGHITVRGDVSDCDMWIDERKIGIYCR